MQSHAAILVRTLHLARTMLRHSLVMMGVLVTGSAWAGTDAPGPVARSIESAAAEAGVPVDLVLAIAIEEGGVHLAPLRMVEDDDHVPVAGALELRHGRLNTLALGAQLMFTTEEILRGDTDLGTRAGARVLAQLGARYGAGESLASWRRALEVLSGMDDQHAAEYAWRVLKLLRDGGAFAARAGETIVLRSHPELGDLPPVKPVAIVADFPGAIWFTTSCTNKCTPGRPQGNAAVNKIIIHDTEGGWNASVATLQYDPDKSVHYIIDADGSRVGQFRPETDTTWHGGNFHYNSTSIGIEHVGTAANPAGYSTALYNKSVDLVQNIRTRWTVPLDRTHIIGHYQIPDGTVIAQTAAPCTAPLGTCETSSQYGGAANHRDPGLHWQWCQYMEKLGGSCTCNDAYELWNCTTDKTEAVRCNNGTVEIAQCGEGCDVMPIGVDDVCHASSTTPPDDMGSGSGGDGSDDPPSGDMTDPPGDKSVVCAVAGGGASLWLVLAALARTRRRRSGK